MDSSKKVFPGDKITAYGLEFTVWQILYQDCICGTYDVEFIDDQARYHHWKQDQDGGHVIRSGIPGDYYFVPDGVEKIGAIRPARTPGTFTARIINRDGCVAYLGRFSSKEKAHERLAQVLRCLKEM